jgi:hypothetical protein
MMRLASYFACHADVTGPHRLHDDTALELDLQQKPVSARCTLKHPSGR